MLSFDVMGVTQYDRAFEALADDVDNMRDPLERVLRSLRAIEVEQFAKEGAAAGNAKWAPLSPAYKRWKDRHYPGKPIMQRTGELHRDLTTDGVISLTDDELVYGPSSSPRPDGETNARIAGWHHEGSGHNPRRLIVAVPEYAKHEWDQFFLTWLRKLEKEQGLR